MSDAVARLRTDAAARTGMTDRTVAGIREVLAGRMRWHSPLLFAGPAVIASIAYMDPGNFATNVQAGAKYNYALLWVVLMASVAAMLFQALSAKLGIVTGRNLAEMCREHFPKPVVWALWIVSEVAAMATDLAEFLGGAIGLSLLLHIPLIAGMGVTGVLTYGILMFEGRGFRPTELIIGSLVAAIALCYLVEMVIAPVDWAAAGLGSVVPRLPDAGAVTIAVGIVGATIMPHAIFLHSGLTQNRAPGRNDRERRLLLRFSNIEVLVALGVAGLVNMAMVIMAASAFHAGHSDVAEIETAYKTLTPLLGPAAAGVFLTALLASGLSSSAVGTMAGQMIMQGFIGFRIPIIVRRLVTMIPAFVVVWLGVNSTNALIFSQVVLSIALPAPVIALILFTRRKDIMGAFANSRLTNAAASFAALVDTDLERRSFASGVRRRGSGASERLTDRRQLVTQSLIFLFKRFEPGTKRRERRLELGFAETRNDVLRTVPVERGDMDDKTTLDLRLGVGQRELRRKLRIGAEIPRLDMRIDLEAPPVGIVHQDQRRAVVCGEIASADVLAVAAKVGDRQRLLVENTDEAGRPAAVLDIGPSVLRDGRHIQAVALGDERRLGWAEAVKGAVAVEVRPIFAAAIRFLRGAHAGRRGDVEKSIGHGGKLHERRGNPATAVAA